MWLAQLRALCALQTLNANLPIPDPARSAKLTCSCEHRCGARGSRRTARLAAIVPGILIAIAPKCPFCWAAYLSAFASLGISVEIPYQPWLLPVLTGLLAVNLIALLLRARGRKRFGAFFLCLLGGAAIVIGKSSFESGLLIALGLACLIAGSLWNAALGTRCAVRGTAANLQAQ